MNAADARIEPGTTVWTEGPAAGARTGPASPYGPNNEHLPEPLVTALRGLVEQLARESEPARREEIRRVKQAHYFWRGLQYLWWSERDQNWHLPFEQKLTTETAMEDLPRYEFVTNIYQAFGQSIIAVLSQSVPRVRFLPRSPTSEVDIATARAATAVAELIERNNRMEELVAQEAFHLWTGGKVGAYVRYVVDGQAFGFHDEPELAVVERELVPARWACAGCGAESPLEATTCGACGASLADARRLPAERVPVPEVVGVRRVPNGQEVITLVGALELKTPPWASELREYPYLQWNMETHLARLRAAYPHAARRLGQAAAADASAQYERLARLSQSQGGPLTQGGDTNQNLITLQRTWMRPWVFTLVEDDALRQQLLALFPDGCYVAFAGDVYLESRNESMDDHWRVLHALPGDGSATGRPALGDALISVQERFNTLTNLQMETYDYGVPPIYVDPQAIDPNAIAYQSAEPGAVYPARPRPGLPLGASFFVPPPPQVPPELVRHTMELMGPVAQFLVGAFPALFGGEMDSQKTATGYAMARDQAMGRLGLVWRRMRQFHADLMLLAVDCFRRNRTEDVEIPVLGAGAEVEARWIRLADLKGNIVAYPEADEQFPALWTQKRAVLLQLMTMNDPAIQQTLALPENLGLVRRLLGLTELEIPGETARTKQMREIARLLEAGPLERTDPATGQLELVPTVLPDGFADDHAVELETCRQWMNSDAGQAARLRNPQGWLNVRAHALLHQRYLDEQTARAARPAPPVRAPAVPAKGE
jgi:ribosomal protein L40E